MTIGSAIEAAPAFLQLGRLNDDEQRTLERLVEHMGHFQPRNNLLESYYEAKQRIKHMGIAMPPAIAERINPVVGWAGTVTDVTEERLDWYGWTEPDDESLGLAEVYADNMLDVEAGPGHLDALLYGVAFVRVGSGADGEASPLVTIHSPRNTTGEWSARRRHLTSALSILDTKDGRVTDAVLDLPGRSLTISRAGNQNWIVDERDDHQLDMVPVARMVNRPRASNTRGRSELTRAVRYYCDAAVRTLLGMEGNREFYGIPQLTLLGRGEDAFVDAAGRPTDGWRIVAGHALAIDKDDDGDVPDIKQLQVGSPQPFLEQVKGWALQLATEAAIPPSYLGYATENPASADAIRAMEARLVKRVERRQTGFGRTWLEVARLALLIRDGAVPDDFHRRVANRWRDAATPTRAAAADETTKYVGAGVLPADSTVTYDRMGLTPTEQTQLRAEKQRAAGSQTLQAILARARTPAEPEPPQPVEESGQPPGAAE